MFSILQSCFRSSFGNLFDSLALSTTLLAICFEIPSAIPFCLESCTAIVYELIWLGQIFYYLNIFFENFFNNILLNSFGKLLKSSEAGCFFFFWECFWMLFWELIRPFLWKFIRQFNLEIFVLEIIKSICIYNANSFSNSDWEFQTFKNKKIETDFF